MIAIGTIGLSGWILNVVVAEWAIRRGARRDATRPSPRAAAVLATAVASSGHDASP